MKVLTSRDQKVIQALAQTLLTRGGRVSQDATDARVVERIDRWMSNLSRAELLKARALFHLFDLWYGVHALNPFARFTAAPSEQRATYLATWEHSEMYARRLAFQGLRQIISIAYMEDEGVRRNLGIEDDLTPEEHLRRLANAADMLRDKAPIQRVG